MTVRYNATTAFKAAAAKCNEMANKHRTYTKNDNEAYYSFLALKDAEREILAFIPKKKRGRK